MLKKAAFGLTWFEFSLLQPFSFLKHGCFTRKGGLSSAPFDSLNVQPFSEENAHCIEENRQRIQRVLGTNMPLVDLEQVHGVHIAVLREQPKKIPPGQFDAMITNVPHIPLMIKHADCQPCLLVDPEHKAIAAIHCGWRGNVQNIYEKVVHTMVEEFGTDPASIVACIGPSLGPCHAEFKDWKRDFPGNFWPFRREPKQQSSSVSRNRNSKADEESHGEFCHFDLWELGREQLMKSGVRKDLIEIANICTFDQKELFFSFRRDGLTGRNATCIVLSDT